MPWSEKQNHLFRAIEHGWKPPASSGIHIKKKDATRMAHEGVKLATGGLAMAGAAPQDNTPLYALPQAQQQAGVPQLSLEQIEAMKPIAGLAIGGRINDLHGRGRGLDILGRGRAGDRHGPLFAGRRYLRDGGYASGGYTAPVSAIGSDVDDGYGGGDGDPRLDPRSRLLAEINKRIQQSTSLGAAQRASTDITGPLRGARRLTLPHLADPWASQYLAHTPFDTALSYGRYPVPDIHNFARGGYADGGSTGDAATGAGALALLPAMRPKILNKIARPIARRLAKPVLGMESVSKHPLPSELQDFRHELARENAGHEFAGLPVERGQGAWQGDNGMEYNNLYSQELPRSMRRMIDSPEHLRYAGQMGENLEQAATPVSRFVPHMINTAEDANAAMIPGIDDEGIKGMASALGPDWVVAHRPGNKAMVFPLGDDQISSLPGKIGGKKLRYGRSDPLLDRVLLTREPVAWGDRTYGEAGAVPRNADYDALEGALLEPRMRRNIGAK